ncbi:hypothetical protein BESB_063550 [Besnoitia besnoiti]|uniref:Armadillo/beta-catenin-like repeat-containing protein n=1 Tax=Besnoitia besnoiti TaxID=94643 RepID=A0A2A9MAG6_BESBE|nr:hypothetical protein BESB_063550 [Besnoitia besnoiti]PFH35468.1 hypothetical protein BESB_063550 [Besnoitia besnoiti]
MSSFFGIPTGGSSPQPASSLFAASGEKSSAGSRGAGQTQSAPSLFPSPVCPSTASSSFLFSSSTAPSSSLFFSSTALSSSLFSSSTAPSSSLLSSPALSCGLPAGGGLSSSSSPSSAAAQPAASSAPAGKEIPRPPSPVSPSPLSSSASGASSSLSSSGTRPAATRAAASPFVASDGAAARIPWRPLATPPALSSLFSVAEDVSARVVACAGDVAAGEEEGDDAKKARGGRSQADPGAGAAPSAAFFPPSVLSEADIREKLVSCASRPSPSGANSAGASSPSVRRSRPRRLMPAVQLSCSCLRREDASAGEEEPALCTVSILRQWSASFSERGLPRSVVALRVAHVRGGDKETASRARDPPAETPAMGCTYMVIVSILGYDVEAQSPFSFVCSNSAGVVALLSESACCVCSLPPPPSRGAGDERAATPGEPRVEGEGRAAAAEKGEKPGAASSAQRRPIYRWMRDEDWEEEEDADHDTAEPVLHVRGRLLLDELRRSLEADEPEEDDAAVLRARRPPRSMVQCLLHPFSESALVLLTHELRPAPGSGGDAVAEETEYEAVGLPEASGAAPKAEETRAVLRLFDLAVSTEAPETEIVIPQPPSPAAGARALPVQFALGCASERLDLWPALAVFLLFPSAPRAAAPASSAPGVALCLCPFLPRRAPGLPAPLALALQEATTQARLLAETGAGRAGGAPEGAAEAASPSGGAKGRAAGAASTERGDSLDRHTRKWLLAREGEGKRGAAPMREAGETEKRDYAGADAEEEARASSPSEDEFAEACPGDRVLPVAQWLALADVAEGSDDGRTAKQGRSAASSESGKRGDAGALGSDAGGRSMDCVASAEDGDDLCAILLFATSPLTLLLTASERGDLRVWAAADEIRPCMRPAAQSPERELKFFLLQKAHFLDSPDSREAQPLPPSPSADGPCERETPPAGVRVGRLSLLPLPPRLTAAAVPAAFVCDAARVALLEFNFLSARAAAAALGSDASPQLSRPWLSLRPVLCAKESASARDGSLLCSISLHFSPPSWKSQEEKTSCTSLLSSLPPLSLVGSCLPAAASAASSSLSSASLLFFSLDVSALLFGDWWTPGRGGAGRGDAPVGAAASAASLSCKLGATKEAHARAEELLRSHETQLREVKQKIARAAQASRQAAESGATKDMRQATAAAAEFASSLLANLQFADECLLQVLRREESRLRVSKTASLARCACALDEDVKGLWATHRRQEALRREHERRLEELQSNMVLLEGLCSEAGKHLRQRDEVLRLRELQEAWAKLERDVAALPGALLEACPPVGAQRGRSASGRTGVAGHYGESEGDSDAGREKGVRGVGAAKCLSSGDARREYLRDALVCGDAESDADREERKAASQLLGAIEVARGQLSLLHQRQANLETLVERAASKTPLN